MTSTIIWPSEELLAPKLARLHAEKGSVVLVAIQCDSFGFLETSAGWFSASERESLKRALSRAKKARQAMTVTNADGQAKESAGRGVTAEQEGKA